MPVKLALVLDRDEAVRSLLSEMLCDEGWLTVCMAPPPPQHKDLVGLRPDLVILELWQDTAKARALLARLVSDNGAALPLVLISTDARLIERLHHDATWQAYPALLKPFQIDELLRLIEHAAIGQGEQMRCLGEARSLVVPVYRRSARHSFN